MIASETFHTVRFEKYGAESKLSPAARSLTHLARHQNDYITAVSEANGDEPFLNFHLR